MVHCNEGDKVKRKVIMLYSTGGRRSTDFDRAPRIPDRRERRFAAWPVSSDGRSVYVLQTMALFPRAKRDTTVK